MFIDGKPNQQLFIDVINQVNINILDNIKIKKNMLWKLLDQESFKI